MRDAGPDVNRKGKRNLVKIAERGFMEGWLNENEENFKEVMDLIKDGAPVQYARLYLDAYKMGVSREQNININITNRQEDRERLQAMVHTRIPEALPSFTPYEEVKDEQ